MQLARRCQDEDGKVSELKAKKLRRDKRMQEKKHKPLYKMIKSYDKSLAEEEKRIAKLRFVQSQSLYDYINIPHLRLRGKQFTNTPHASACRRQCDRRGSCRSYAYNSRTKDCYWSTKTLDYDQSFVLYLKQRGNGRTNKEFFPIPGLKGEEGDQATFTGVQTLGECKYNCFTDTTCDAVSYNAEKGECKGQSSGLEYNPDYQYYEKHVENGLEGGRPYDKAEMEGRFAVENQEKARLKGQFDEIMKLEAQERKAKATPAPTPFAELGDARQERSPGLLPTTPGWEPVPLPRDGVVHGFD